GEGRLDLPALLEVCRRHGLRTLAIRAGREEDIAAAQALDLPVLPPSGARERPLDIKDSAPRKPAEEPSPSAGEARPEPAKAEENPPEPVSRPNKVVEPPVRGGTQLYPAGGALIVLAAVSPGAELLAGGNCHVYRRT
ncbi:septum site-determining protein MinC, partial [Pseudomonas aeruginosa]